MSSYEYILDNRRTAVVDYLRRRLPEADVFRLVSAYFTIYGYQLLADELSNVRNVKFLFGEPASVGDIDPGRREVKSFDLTEDGLAPNHAIQQKFLAKQCAEWIKKRGVSVRSVRKSNFLHGKMYMTKSSGEKSAIVGSSNFTKGGLGGAGNSNVEINVATTESSTIDELERWFDELWSDRSLTYNAKQEVLDALGRLGRENAPEFIYYKTLFELFREELESRRDGEQELQDNNLYTTAIWNALYEFQKDGAKSVISRLKQSNGCILADSVGLGKTYTALAVIKYYELRNRHVLVLCPKKLRENWSMYRASVANPNNPFIDDRFGYTLLSHTDLSRTRGMTGDVDLSNFNWGGFDLIVIDESHNFRNMGGSRYSRLLEEVIKQGAETKVLMLSATPVNTSLTDLRNQIYLATEGREDDFRESLGVGNIRNLLGAAQREFKQWENKRDSQASGPDKAELLNRLSPEFFRLLGGLSISRSRRQIEQYYAHEMERIGHFPERKPPINVSPPTDASSVFSYKELVDQIEKFELSIYRPSDYLINEDRKAELKSEREARNFNQQDRERFLIGMMRTNFMKRLESSAHALTLTLERTIGKIDELIAMIDRYDKGLQVGGELIDALPDEDEDDEEFFVNRGRNPYRLSELDLSRWRKDLMRDRTTLNSVWTRVSTITPERDGKLRQIKKDVAQKCTDSGPELSAGSQQNRKMLIFTTFKDTAVYLYENLQDIAEELELKIAMVSGDVTHTTLGDNNFNSILTNFAPRARQRGVSDLEVDLLIATDCISEGQNLQDCDTVLNYDIHWNPVRLIQRFGRIDRIGSQNDTVNMINYWPTEDMDSYLKLQNRVQARMALADMAASGDEDIFTTEEAQMELRFRDEQLLKLREEILDLDELSDSVVMSDFTLDHFFTQLLRYLERNREELEAAPLGAYAVTWTNQGRSESTPVQPGVIFLLRHRGASTDSRQRRASALHPYYAVFIQFNGIIRFGCANARQVLAVFEQVAVDIVQPIIDLCDQFDRSTRQGEDMGAYDTLLRDVVGHIRESHKGVQSRGLGISGERGFRLPLSTESPDDVADFELVTWLIIEPPEPEIRTSNHSRRIGSEQS